MMRLRMAEQWDSYAREVLPKNAPTVQRWECRRAFYSGAQALFMGVLMGLSSGEEVTEADLQGMSAHEPTSKSDCRRD